MEDIKLKDARPGKRIPLLNLFFIFLNRLNPLDSLLGKKSGSSSKIDLTAFSGLLSFLESTSFAQAF
jgi:hypothetical protein